jgi:hypothetical protein
LRTDRDFDRVPRRDDTRAGRQTAAVALSHQQDPFAIKSDGLGGYEPTRLALDKAALADCHADAARFHYQSNRSDETAMNYHGITLAQSRSVAVEPSD